MELTDLARFDRLSAPPAWQMVADSLRRKIALGLYRPGDVLPSERQLAEGMGVSRITVREALRVLQGERLVESRRSNSGGAQVCAPRSRPHAEVRAELRRERGRFLQILDCRIANESLAARLAARLRTEAHLAALEQTIPAMAAASRTLEEVASAIDGAAPDEVEAARPRGERAAIEFRRQDSIFHLTIAAIPANRYLFRTVEWLRTEFFTPVDLLYRSRNRQDSAGEHTGILAAVRDRDEERASRRMREHIASTRRALDALLEAE